MTDDSRLEGPEDKSPEISSSSDSPSPPVSAWYRFLRGLVRARLRFHFRKLRVLGAVSESDSGPVLFVTNRPENFWNALILVASFERRIYCLLSQPIGEGFLRRLVARGLGVATLAPPAGSSAGDQASMIDAARELLAQGEAVAIFLEPRAPAAESASVAASLALSTVPGNGGQVEPKVFPAHLFVPLPGSILKEIVIHVETPVPLSENVPPGARSYAEQVQSLAGAIETKLREGPFGLRPEDIELTFSDLEELLREDLQEEWASRSDWKQSVEGFRLSGYVREWVERMNELHPERLVALRIALATSREARRRAALLQLEAEGVGADSLWRQARARCLEPLVPLRVRRVHLLRRGLLDQLDRCVNEYAETQAGRVDARAPVSDKIASAGHV